VYHFEAVSCKAAENVVRELVAEHATSREDVANSHAPGQIKNAGTLRFAAAVGIVYNDMLNA